MSSDHIILDALEAAVYERIDSGELDADVLDGLPEGYVFYPNDFDAYDEDSVAAVRAVGVQDVAAKIGFYRQVLDR